MAELVLIADDDSDVARAVELNLNLAGYDTAIASDGEEAVAKAIEIQPDLIILDIVMPKLDGFQVCKALHDDPRTTNVAIILLTARSIASDKVLGLSVGADDYIVKPFEPTVLSARVKSVLRRSSQMRDLSPLTHLPGNFRIASELEKFVSTPDSEFAVLYCDIGNFKAYNDYYGFLKGDEVIKFAGHIIAEALHDFQSLPRFLGHIGGDDFVAIVAPGDAEDIAKDIINRFDDGIVNFYETEDRTRGYIDVKDRQSNISRFGFASLVIGIVSTEFRDIRSQWEASVTATEMKSYAKRHGKSAYEIDRRSNGEGHIK